MKDTLQNSLRMVWRALELQNILHTPLMLGNTLHHYGIQHQVLLLQATIQPVMMSLLLKGFVFYLIYKILLIKRRPSGVPLYNLAKNSTYNAENYGANGSSRFAQGGKQNFL